MVKRAPERATHADAEEPARDVGLRYSSDTSPGIRRRRAGRGWIYLEPDSGRITDERTLARIRAHHPVCLDGADLEQQHRSAQRGRRGRWAARRPRCDLHHTRLRQSNIRAIMNARRNLW